MEWMGLRYSVQIVYTQQDATVQWGCKIIPTRRERGRESRNWGKGISGCIELERTLGPKVQILAIKYQN